MAPPGPSSGCVVPCCPGLGLPRGGCSTSGTASALLASAFYWLQGVQGRGCGSDPAPRGLFLEGEAQGHPVGAMVDGWDMGRRGRDRAQPAACPGAGAVVPALPSRLSPQPRWLREPPPSTEGPILPQLSPPGAQRPLPSTSSGMASRPCCVPAATEGWRMRVSDPPPHLGLPPGAVGLNPQPHRQQPEGWHWPLDAQGT